MIEGALLGLLIVLGATGITLLCCLLLTSKDQWPWKGPEEK